MDKKITISTSTSNVGIRTGHLKHTSLRGARSRVLPDVNRSELARRLGIGRSYVSKVLSGSVSPGVEMLEGLAREFGVSMEEMNHRLKTVREGRKSKGKRRS